MLSVIIPTFGRTASLDHLLKALRSQTLQDIEILVVDQNRPGFLSAGLSDHLETVRHIPVDEPNVSLARNVGFASSSGSLILFLDDDMIPDREFCAKGAALLTKLAEVNCLCAVVYTSAAELEAIRAVGHSDATWHSRTFGLSKPGVPSWYQKRNMTGRRISGAEIYEIKDCPSGATFFSRSFFARSGGFDEILFRYARTAEDQELFSRMHSRGMRMWFARDLTVYHDHDSPGGCDLRSGDYWLTRERCVKAWAFRHRVHGKVNGRISVRGAISLMRSTFLNSGLRQSSLRDILREIELLRRAVRDSRQYLEPYLEHYGSTRYLDHLQPYMADDQSQRG
jgi:GT2 family glycosyltransferase